MSAQQQKSWGPAQKRNVEHAQRTNEWKFIGSFLPVKKKKKAAYILAQKNKIKM